MSGETEPGCLSPPFNPWRLGRGKMGRGRGAYWPRVVVWRHLLAGAALVAPLLGAVRGHLGLATLLIGRDLTVEGEGGALGLPGVRREAMGWCGRGE